MLDWAATFLEIAIVAGALGFTGVTGPALEIARVLFYVFLALTVAFYGKQEYSRAGIKDRPIKKRFNNKH